MSCKSAAARKTSILSGTYNAPSRAAIFSTAAVCRNRFSDIRPLTLSRNRSNAASSNFILFFLIFYKARFP
jgi:hypothetical protein